MNAPISVIEEIEKAKKDKNFNKGKRFNELCVECSKYENLIDPTKKYIAILGSGASLLGEWDPFDIETGIPGSEECVIYLANELAKRGYIVHIYMNPPKNSIYRLPLCNPRYMPSIYYISSANKYRYDVVILWRMYTYFMAKIRGTKTYIWVHDYIKVGENSPLRKIQVGNFDGLMLLTEHSRDNIYDVFTDSIKVQNLLYCSGVVLEQFHSPMKFTNPLSIGYYSNNGRGLIVLLKNWDKIISKFPEATLYITYGKQTWNIITNNELQEIIKLIDKYPKSIKDYGKLGHQQLADLMMETSVWAYPYIKNDETFCLTAVKAQLAGNIPVIYRRDSLDSG